MNGLIKMAALAAMLASAAGFAQTTPSTTGTQSPDFSTLDANGDGSVSKDEAKADASLSAKFAELDADKDGKLSSSEYQKGAGKKKEGY